jgi:hypothetical protein
MVASSRWIDSTEVFFDCLDSVFLENGDNSDHFDLMMIASSRWIDSTDSFSDCLDSVFLENSDISGHFDLMMIDAGSSDFCIRPERCHKLSL